MTEHLELKAQLSTDEAGAIVGIAWPFGSPDRTGDVVTKGAFAGAPGRLPMLWSHDPTETIGVWDSVQETGAGLEVRGRLLVDDVPRAREVRALVREGAATGLSIGFTTKSASPRKGGGRTIRALDLVEVSVVSVPAHPGATVTSVKGGPEVDENEDHDEAADTAVDDRITEIETKIADVAEIPMALDKVTKRLDEIEKLARRPRQTTTTDEPAAEVKAFTSFVRSGAERMDPVEVKDLRVAVDTAGGYLAPDQFSTEMLKNLVEISPVRSAARVSSIASGSITLPRRTGQMTARWVGETETRTQTEPSYGQVTIEAWELACYVDVSQQLLEDSAVDIASELSMDFAEEFARAEAVAFLNGSGIKQPEGIMTNPDVATVANGDASAITIDGLIDIFQDLPAFYRNRGAWMMNSATIGAVRKLKDTDGNYLWRDSLVEGNPATILGRPVVDAPDLEDISAGATPIVFGAFADAYRIVDRVGLQVLRDPYTLATTGLVRFHARRRTGGRIVKAEAIRKLSMEV